MSKHWKWDEIGLRWEDTLQCICVNLRMLGSWLSLLLVVVRARILRVFLHLWAFQLSQKFISSWSFMIFMLLRMISGCFLRIWSISCCSEISSNFSAPKPCLGEQTSSLIGSLADFMDYLWVTSMYLLPSACLVLNSVFYFYFFSGCSWCIVMSSSLYKALFGIELSRR